MEVRRSKEMESYELRLLRCLLAGPRESGWNEQADAEGEAEVGKDINNAVSRNVEDDGGISDDHRTLEEGIREVVVQIEKGLYGEALASKWMVSLLGEIPSFDAPAGERGDAAKSWYEFIESRASAFSSGIVVSWPSKELGGEQNGGLVGPLDEEGAQQRAILVLAFGVAALCAFVQANLTGPTKKKLPSFPLGVAWGGRGEPAGFDEKEWEAWARLHLMVDGCDLMGKFELPQYLILAKLLLVSPAELTVKIKEFEGGSPKTWTWWAFRTMVMHQRILAERSASLRSLLSTLSHEILKDFGTIELVQELGWNLQSQEVKTMVAAVHLEIGYMEHLYGHNDAARQSFETAGEACGLELELTGVLGFRTKYQQDPKAQMVLISTTTDEQEASSWLDFLDESDTNQHDTQAKAKESEVLLAPKLVAVPDDTNDFKSSEGHKKVLRSIEQAVILAQCMDVKKSNPEDELRSWQMAPYIEAVDGQQRSPQMVKALCQLLRIRWEKTRSRTRERSFLMMEQLADEIRDGPLKVSQRMSYAFSVPFPVFPALLKEYAEVMVSFGMVGDAMVLFEELELWNNLIDCYCLLGKKAAAVDLIRQRLQVQPNEPRLWCSLGDVIMDDDCYYKAWEVSGQRFSRAQRSLARTAYSKCNYVKAIQHWDLALSLNPLHPDGWFALGSAALKAKELDKAVHAFTRQVQLDPENGESWNNIAAINMQKKRSKEAFVAFREALKLKRNSWQMWENFAQVAVDVSNFGQAILALEKVLDLSQDKRVDVIVYTSLVEELEIRKGLRVRKNPVPDPEIDKEARMDTHQVADLEDGFHTMSPLGLALPTISSISRTDCRKLRKVDSEEVTSSDVSDGTTASMKDTDILIDKVGKLLSRIIAKGQGGGAIWGLKARWHKIMGDLPMCIEALLKQVRAYQGSRWQGNQEQFEIFAHACLQLCEAYVETSHSGTGKRELSAAQMLLRNTIKQAESFKSTQYYQDLESFLQKIQQLMTCV